MKWIIVICLSLTGTAFGQMSIEEAQERLNERVAQREAQRSQTVTVTVGEIQDLQQSIRQLQAVVAQQQQELARLRRPVPAPVYQTRSYSYSGDDSYSYYQPYITTGWGYSNPIINAPIYLPGPTYQRSCRVMTVPCQTPRHAFVQPVAPRSIGRSIPVPNQRTVNRRK